MIPVRLASSATRRSPLRESVLSSRRRKKRGESVARDGLTRSSVLEVIQENMETLALYTVVLHDNTGATNDLAGVTLPVDLAKTRPLTELLVVGNLDQVDLVLSAQRLDELEVLGGVARLDEDTQMGLALVESLGALAETTGETVVDEGVFQDLL